MGTIHRPPLLSSTITVTMVRLTDLPITTLNPPIVVHPAGADLLTIEQTKLVMGQTAGFPVLAPTALQIVVSVASSIAHNGRPPGLMVVAARLAPV
jgi:hypothetical protein